MERLAGAPGGQLAGAADGKFNPEKDFDCLARNIISGSTLSGLGYLNAGRMVQGETQLQKTEAYQEENKSVLTSDRRTIPSLEEPKAEVRCIQCKEEENRYIEELFEHKLTVRSQWRAK